jgi:hypothetical protein
MADAIDAYKSSHIGLNMLTINSIIIAINIAIMRIKTKLAQSAALYKTSAMASSVIRSTSRLYYSTSELF